MQQQGFPWAASPTSSTGPGATSGPSTTASPPPPSPPPPPPAAALSAELEAALLRELVRVYAWENHARFKNRLKPPMLVLADTSTRLGQWTRAGRRLELSRPMLIARPWPEVVSVLLHEMAHQYVDEVLAAHHEDPHGPTFQEVCEARGIDARAHGAPVPVAGSAAPIDRTLDKIRKLLALAGSANQHEAELAMRTAHELMLRHNLDGVPGQRDYQVRHVGDPTVRRTTAESLIAGILAEFFFVKVLQIPVYLPLLGRSGHTYELTGTAPNLDMAEHVYEFLRATAERLWQANRNDARVKSGHDRMRYQAGVIQGFHDKLGAQAGALAGTGLIWIADADLDAFHRRRNPRIVHKRRRLRIDGAHAAGREAGRRIVLSKPITRGPSGGGPKLLG
ncbi:MAG: DUF2786 domain-containing protein [Myxococcales bacterium]|nr:DUF2786 domain-containing protein [Myxococcales bacterium]